MRTILSSMIPRRATRSSLSPEAGGPARRSLGGGGFTLIELLIALAILGLMLSAVYRIFSSQEKFVRKQEMATAMQEDLRSLSEFINQEMSWGGYRVSGIAVQYAATNMCIFSGAIPGLSSASTTVSFVAYYYESGTGKLWRGVAPTLAGVQLPLNANHRVLADNVAGLTFTYYDFAGGSYDITTPLTSPTNDNALKGIQRIRASVTIRSPRPDNAYVYPAPPYDHYYRRSGVIDVKLRNVEDVSISGTSVGSGGCGFFEMTVTPSNYAACADTPSKGIAGNPRVHVKVTSGTGAPNSVTPVSVNATGGYQFVEASNPTSLINNVANRVAGSGDVYLMWGNGSTGEAGVDIDIVARFTPPEAGCVELSRTARVSITAGLPSHFDTTGALSPTGVQGEIIYLYNGTPVAGATTIPVCPASNQVGARLTAKVVDDCGNGIPGQTVAFSADKGSFASGTVDNGDGTYSIVYRPPDAITGTSDTVAFTAVWGARTLSRTIGLTPGRPAALETVDITGPMGGGVPLYQFAHPSANAFRIERLSNQHVAITFKVKDGCGNKVFDELSRLTAAASFGCTTAIVANPDGTYTFDWYSPYGCGRGVPGQTITIADSSTPSVPSLVIAFDLLPTSEAAKMNFAADGVELTPGCTGDGRALTVSIVKNVADVCENVPGPFKVTFTVAGKYGSLGNGSFSASNLSLTTIDVTADNSGVAAVQLYPGSCKLGQELTVTAVAEVRDIARGDATGVASMTGTRSVSTKATPPGGESGFYKKGYAVQMGGAMPQRSSVAGSNLYFEIKDCDENADVFAVDSQGAPWLTVALTSSNGLVTRDHEVVNLTETLANSAVFRPNGTLYTSDNGFPSQLADVGVAGDGKLQVRPGDLVTLSYHDVDGASVNDYSWSIFIAGARSLTLYQGSSPATARTIIVGGAQVVTMAVTPSVSYFPQLYLPQYELDGFSGATTVRIANRTPTGETDIFVMRESGDTGIFRPVIGGHTSVEISKDPAVPPTYLPEGWLVLPTTPIAVIVEFPPVSPYLTAGFVVSDSEAPDCSITAPLAGSTVGSAVAVAVYAFDRDNAIDPGISKIEFYVDGRLIATRTPGLNGTNAFTWVTQDASGRPLYLDGQHTLTARAWDKAGNGPTQSTPVVVTLANGHSPLWFVSPPELSVWSDVVGVTFKTSVDTSLGSYTPRLVIGSTNRPLTVVDPYTWSYSWATRAAPAAVDGTYQLYATLRDDQANSTAAAVLDLVVDHTAPAIGMGLPAWIGSQWPFSAPFTASDANGVAPTSVSAAVSGACGNPVTVSPAGGSNYTLNWASPCEGVTGSVTLTVTARDLASPPNVGTRTVRTSYDTLHPVMTAPTAAPRASTLSYTGAGYFVKGTTRVGSQVTDLFPFSAHLVFDYLGATGWTPFSQGFDRPLDNPSTGAFHYTWITTGEHLPGQPWPNGPYQVTPSGKDQAGNANTNSAVGHFYVDNGVPWAMMMGGGTPIGPWGGNLRHNADPNSGWLRQVEIAVMDAGEHPALQSPIYSRSVPYAATSQVSYWVNGVSTWHPVGRPDGNYDGYIRALDWAGNRSAWSGPNTVRIVTKWIDTLAGIFTVQGSKYNLTVSGRVMGAGGPVAGQSVGLVTWRYAGSWNSRSDNVSTAGDGTFSLQIPNGSFDYDAGNSAQVDVTLEPGSVAQGNLFGVAPNPLSPSLVNTNNRLVLDPQATVTPLGGNSFQVTLSGRRVDSFTGPRAGTAVHFEYWQYDNSWATKGTFTQDAFTDGSGNFSVSFVLNLAPGDHMSFNLTDPVSSWWLGSVQSRGDSAGWSWPSILNLSFN